VKDAIYMADRACRAAKVRRGDGLVIYTKAAPEFGERKRELRLVEHLGADDRGAGAGRDRDCAGVSNQYCSCRFAHFSRPSNKL
jgi:hypothetical protein